MSNGLLPNAEVCLLLLRCISNDCKMQHTFFSHFLFAFLSVWKQKYKQANMATLGRDGGIYGLLQLISRPLSLLWQC